MYNKGTSRSRVAKQMLALGFRGGSDNLGGRCGDTSPEVKTRGLLALWFRRLPTSGGPKAEGENVGTWVPEASDFQRPEIARESNVGT